MILLYACVSSRSLPGLLRSISIASAAGIAFILSYQEARAETNEAMPASVELTVQAGNVRPSRPHSHIHAAGEIDENQRPLVLEANYVFDVWRTASGGIARGNRYIDNLDVVVEADMERLVGWKGAEVSLYGLYNNGNSLNDLVGDAQVVSNIESGVQAVRLHEAWISQKIGKRASVKIGLYDLNSEFDALNASRLFMGSAHGIGTDISQSGQNGPSIFPFTSLAARLAIELSGGWKIRAAVLDGVPADPGRPARTAIKLGNGDGALLVGELEAPFAQGKLLIGHWQYASKFDTWSGKLEHGNSGWYVRGESHLSHEASNPDQGLAGFFRLGYADGRFNQFDGFASAGLRYTGLVKGRDADELGIAVASAFTAKGYRLVTKSDRHETVFELTYRAQLTNWLSIQPNIQYVVNPNADPSVQNALAFGFRTELNIRFPG